RVALEENEEAEQEGPPLPPDELADYCAEMGQFVDALAGVPPRLAPAEREERLRDLPLDAAALADRPPPGIGSALAEARAALEAVTKEANERGFDLGGGDQDILAPLPD